MLVRIALYSTLGLVLEALGCQWDTPGFWCVVGLFWANETHTRVDLIEELNRELELMRKKHKENTND